MKRFLRYSLLAIVVVALSSPAFAVVCRSCGDNGHCFHNPNSGTGCMQMIDFCTEFTNGCTGVADRETLAESLTVVSVEVVTPAGVKTTPATPSLAARQPVTRGVPSTFTR